MKNIKIRHKASNNFNIMRCISLIAYFIIYKNWNVVYSRFNILLELFYITKKKNILLIVASSAFVDNLPIPYEWARGHFYSPL